MKKQRLTNTDKHMLAHKAYRSSTEKASDYPAWMQSIFEPAMDNYYSRSKFYNS